MFQANRKIVVNFLLLSLAVPFTKCARHWDLGSFVVDNVITGLSVFDSKQITHMISPALNFLSNYRVSTTKTTTTSTAITTGKKVNLLPPSLGFEWVIQAEMSETEKKSGWHFFIF